MKNHVHCLETLKAKADTAAFEGSIRCASTLVCPVR